MSLTDTVDNYSWPIVIVTSLISGILSFSAWSGQGLLLGAIGADNLSINFILSALFSLIAGWVIVYEWTKGTGRRNHETAFDIAIGGVLGIGGILLLGGRLGGYQGWEGLVGGFLTPVLGAVIHEVRTQATSSMGGGGTLLPDGGRTDGGAVELDRSSKEEGVNKTEKELHELEEEAEQVREIVSSAAQKSDGQKIKRIEKAVHDNMVTVEKAVEDNEEKFETIQKEVIKAEENPQISKKVEGDEQSGHQEILQDLKRIKQALEESHEELKGIEKSSHREDVVNKIDGAREEVEHMMKLFQDLEEVEETVLEAEETETQQLEKFEQLWERNQEFIMGLDEVAGGDLPESEIRTILEKASQDMQRPAQEMAKESMELVEIAQELENEVEDDSKVRKVLQRTEAAEKVYQAFHG